MLQDKTFNADGSMFYPTQGVTRNRRPEEAALGPDLGEGQRPAAVSSIPTAVPAAANENGRKDKVQAHAGLVTRIRARFELPDEGTIVLPPGVDNPQYVWHCHILEHEENDMMRAFEVVT